MTKLPDALERLRPNRRKKDEETTTASGHLQCCLDCTHWRSNGETELSDYANIAYGRCLKNGGGCPPMHTCAAWESSNGDTKRHPAGGLFYF